MNDVVPVPKGVALRKKAITKKRARGKIDKKQSDILFSLIIRKRDGKCVRCGKDNGRLECSHIYSRSYVNTRCDELNAKTLCHACHRWWGLNPVDTKEWIVASGVRTADEMEELRHRALERGVKIDWAVTRAALKSRALEIGAI